MSVAITPVSETLAAVQCSICHGSVMVSVTGQKVAELLRAFGELHDEHCDPPTQLRLPQDVLFRPRIPAQRRA